MSNDEPNPSPKASPFRGLLRRGPTPAEAERNDSDLDTPKSKFSGLLRRGRRSDAPSPATEDQSKVVSESAPVDPPRPAKPPAETPDDADEFDRIDFSAIERASSARRRYEPREAQDPQGPAVEGPSEPPEPSPQSSSSSLSAIEQGRSVDPGASPRESDSQIVESPEPGEDVEPDRARVLEAALAREVPELERVVAAARARVDQLRAQVVALEHDVEVRTQRAVELFGPLGIGDSDPRSCADQAVLEVQSLLSDVEQHAIQAASYVDHCTQAEQQAEHQLTELRAVLQDVRSKDSDFLG